MENIIETLSDVFALAKNCTDFVKEILDATKKEKNNKDSAQLASSGDYAQLASSGDSAQIDSTGKKAVVSAIGIESAVKAIKMYRVITGACEAGTKYFVSGLTKTKAKYKVSELIKLTAGQYGNETFKNFFEGK